MKIAVVGAGIVGLSCAKALINRKSDVTVFDPLSPMSVRSSGGSRIFRLAHRDPVLIELAIHAREIFDKWESETGEELIVPTTTVITGEDLSEWTSAFEATNASFEQVHDSSNLALPISGLSEPSVIDKCGGVIKVNRIRAFLTSETQHVLTRTAVQSIALDGPSATVMTAAGAENFDAVVVAAGANTPRLVQAAGFDLPTKLVHHFRFTFPLWQGGQNAWPAWIANVCGLRTYQHQSASGQWAIGSHVDNSLMSTELPRAVAEKSARSVVLDYVVRHLPAIDPSVVETVYCQVNPGVGDGYRIERSGPVLVVYGENLFKIAPVLGEILADAALCETTPLSV